MARLTKLPSAERKGLYFSLQVYKLIKDYLTERNEMFMTAIEVVLHDHLTLPKMHGKQQVIYCHGARMM